MSKEEKRVPEVRFEGFYDDWKQRKLGNLAEINPKSELPTNFEYVDLGSVIGTNLISHKNLDKQNSPSRAQRLARYGDVFYQTVRPYQKNNYLFDLPYCNYVFSTGYAQLRPYIDGYFLLSSLQGSRFVLKVLNNCTGTSYPAINSKDLSQIKLSVPNGYSEQNKIGTLFKLLDNTIALHQRKLEKLQELKKAALQSFFPKKDELMPKVRFANFEDQWAVNKIKELFSERTSRSKDGELISVTIDSGVVKASELDRKDNSSTNKSNYKLVKKGDIAYNSMRMWQGASGYSPYNGILSPAYTVIVPKSGINSKFFSFMFKKNEMIQVFKRNSQGLTSDTWNLKFPVLSSIKVKVPVTREQVQIETYMSKLDNVIDLFKSKLETLKALKKSFLKKLFI